MIRYTVHADRVDENERYVRAVFDELARARPDGLRYTTLKLDDGVTFVHIAFIEREDDVHPLRELESFKAFTASVNDRCAVLPVTTHVEMVGGYRAFGA
jgi:hypothetical protein